MTRRFRWTFWIALGFSSLLVITLAVAWLTSWRAGIRSRELQASLVERGVPLDLATLQPLPLEDADNAAVPLRQLREIWIPPEPELLTDLEPLFELADLEPAARARIQQWLAANEAASHLLEDALDRSDSQFGFEHAELFSTLEADRWELAQTLKLLIVPALLAAEDGRTEEAFARLEEALGLPHRLYPEPLLITLLARRNLYEEIVRSLQLVLQRRAPSLQRCRSLRGALESIRPRAELFRALRIELGMGDGFFSAMLGEREWPSQGSPEITRDTGLLGRLLSVLHRIDRVTYLERGARLLDLASEPWHDSEAGWKALEEGEVRSWALLSSLVTPKLSRHVLSMEELRALLDLTWLALSIEEVVLETGAPPSSLPEPPETSERGVIDPFTGAVYRYTVDPDGYVLESRHPEPGAAWRLEIRR